MLEHETIDRLSSHNKEEILDSKQCGCYHCLAKFGWKEIKDWLDYGETAVCPKCGVDSVISLDDVESGNTTQTLQEMNQQYFSYYSNDEYEDY